MSSEFDIAVVGMACRFPGAPDLESYAQLLLEGRDAARSLSEEELRAAGVPERLIADAKYVRVAMPLDGVDLFDAGFFGISPRDAAIMDPQHRHFFECAWHALEHAGHPPARFRERTGGRIGVFAGSGMNGYLVHNLLSNQELFESVGWFLIRHTANDKDFLSTRVSYEFDLRGPSLNIQTACSTSLVAIHEAVQHLLNGECELALAGGVTIELPQNHGYLHKEGEILAPDGICRAFEERSAGTIFGSGSGCVVLRRLEDALADGDTIHAVVAGSAVNNDGRRKVSYLAPSVDGHADAVRDALSIAQLSADAIDYVEAHGTGTRVGDPIEVEALSTAFRDSTQASGYCGLGSVKPSIGHLDTAAGIASFLKVVLGLQHETIPATAHFEKANPLIDFASTPFTVVGEPRAWPRGSRPRHAGVSSLGVGGTNAHVIVREAPEQEPSPRAGRLQLLPLSAKAAAPLERARENLAQHLEGEHAPSLADASWTLLEGREAFAHRAVVVARSHTDAAEALRDPKRCITHEHDGRTPKTVFLFPGGGAQHPRMAVELYNFEPRFRRHVDRCLELMSEPELVRAAMLPDDAHLEDARKALERPPIGLPALFAIEYALALYLEELGLRGDLMLGHSLGEYTAACLAGVFSLEQALRVIELRGRLMEQAQGGGMLSVEMPTEELEALLQSRFGADGAALCAQNSPSLNVVSGADEQLDELASVLTERQIEHKRLRIRVAAHSPLLDPILDEFEAGVAAMQLAPASRPFVSNLSGELVTGTVASNAEYWRRHLREPVRFAAGVSRALQAEGRLFLEIGPGATLSTFVRMHEETRDRRAIIGFLPHPKDDTPSDEHVLQSLGRAWMFGAALDASALLGQGRRRVPLPGYSFERKRHWIDPGTRQQLGEHESNELTRLRFDHFFSELVAVPEAASSDERLSFQRTLLIGADSDFSLELEAALAESGQKIIRAYPPNGQRGSSKKQRRKAKFLATSVVHEIDFAKRSDWDSIFDECTRDLGSLPDQILWLEEDASTAKPETHWQRSFALARSLASREADEVISIQLLGRGYHRVEPDEAVHPELGALLGPLRVLPSEWPSASFGVLDLGDASLAHILEALRMPLHEQGRILRREARLVLERRRLEPDPTEDAASLLRHRGCYVITGGLGGVGLTLARALASSHEARLVLVSRTGLPARAQWERWLQLRGEDETGQRIRACMEMEREGARILTIAADITQTGDLGRACEVARAEFGQVHGVFHAAGLLDDAPILAKREEEGLRVLAPKLQGARELEDLSGGWDFALLFSSTSALWGLPGQSDYCAANAYLERLGHAQTASGKLRVAAFGPWRALGMTAEMADTGEERLSVAESSSATLSLLDSVRGSLRASCSTAETGAVAKIGNWRDIA
jgi:acyl transferase domain-containing protein